MWIERKDKQQKFLKSLEELKSQVIVVRGARRLERRRLL